MPGQASQGNWGLSLDAEIGIRAGKCQRQGRFGWQNRHSNSAEWSKRDPKRSWLSELDLIVRLVCVFGRKESSILETPDYTAQWPFRATVLIYGRFPSSGVQEFRNGWRIAPRSSPRLPKMTGGDPLHHQFGSCSSCASFLKEVSSLSTEFSIAVIFRSVVLVTNRCGISAVI